MTFLQFKQKLASGQSVRCWFIGNSIGCGYRSLHSTIGDDNLSGKLDTTSSSGQWKLQAAYRESAIAIGSVAQQLRSYVLGKNASSVFRNESGNGWNTNNHLGYSGYPYAQDTIALVIAANAVNPIDAVFLPLVVNDCNHNLGVSTFVNNTTTIVNRLLAAGILPILVKESDLDQSNMWNTPGVDYSHYPNYIAAVDTVANSYSAGSVGVVDTYTPTHNAIMAHGGYSGDASMGPTVRVLWDYGTELSANHWPGLHPTQVGHNLIYNAYVSELESLVATTTTTTTTAAPTTTTTTTTTTAAPTTTTTTAAPTTTTTTTTTAAPNALPTATISMEPLNDYPVSSIIMQLVVKPLRVNLSGHILQFEATEAGPLRIKTSRGVVGVSAPMLIPTSQGRVALQ